MSDTEVGRLAVSDVLPGHAVRLEAGTTGICVVRIGDAFYAIGDRCSHAKVSLSEGDVDVTECTIECWKHGSAFSLRTGEPLSLPAVKPVPVYDVDVDGADLVIREREPVASDSTGPTS